MRDCNIWGQKEQKFDSLESLHGGSHLSGHVFCPLLSPSFPPLIVEGQTLLHASVIYDSPSTILINVSLPLWMKQEPAAQDRRMRGEGGWGVFRGQMFWFVSQSCSDSNWSNRMMDGSGSRGERAGSERRWKSL